MFAAALTFMLLSAVAGDGSGSADADGYPHAVASSDYSGLLRDAGPPKWNIPQWGRRAGDGWPRHTYPAYHGIYYRRPYNYRNLYDYPWRERIDEPESRAAYRLPAPESLPTPPPDEVPPPPREISSRAHPTAE